jgi:hypothetical protein
MLAILWMAYSALNVISGVMTIAIADTVVRNIGRIIQMPAEVSLVLHPIMVSAGVLTLVKAAASFLAGWGLLQREPWARILALVVAFIGLLNLPLGTALGIYTIWVLLPTESDQEYRSLALRQAA